MNKRMHTAWLALLLIGGVWLGGCDKPCQVTSECDTGQVCAGAICQTLSCEAAFLATDPATGSCVALSGCFLTEEQRGWRTCFDNPCVGKDENSCVSDSRCQPAYHNPQFQASRNGDETIACAGRVPTPGQPPGPDGQLSAPGVNNGDAPKHRPTIGGAGCVPNSARAYAGCRAIAQLPKRPACNTLTKDACGARPDCTDGSDQGGGDVFGRPEAVPIDPPIGVCFDRVSISQSCEGADARSCLLNPKCQPIGSKCYCPPGGSCACQDGVFLGCEDNDHLRRCQSAAECGAGERCDRDEACIQPRTFTAPPDGTTPTPGSSSCLGACVPTGCAGYGEKACHEHPECDAGAYGTVCHPKPYCQSDRTDPQPPDPTNPNNDGVGATCGCETEFLGCAPLPPLQNVRAERSLLVRDPEIVSDPAFRIDSVLTRLAPAGRGDDFVRTWFQRLGAPATLANGATAQARRGAQDWFSRTSGQGGATLAGLAQRMHTTALVNRVDLAGPGDCGEARLTFAMNSAYTDGNQRMTLIVELRVPDDGMGCRSVAQRWGELSLIEDGAERLLRLKQIYADLLRPERVGQLRTNEFLNRFGAEAWELREWRLGADGLPELAPVKQTVSPQIIEQAGFLGWARQNAAALKGGSAVVPAQYLAAASTENGARLRLAGSDTDAVMKDAEKGLNSLSCAGCHLTETRSPFAHIGERLGRQTGQGYVPAGRAVIDEFLQKELITRAQNLQTLLTAPQKALLLPPFRTVRPASVH